ncbi:homoserine O-acetyltransferase MetX [Endomicrobium proavitum]|uniref:Homoserine O-acetyltransferase n=1 Tax=Endomicrobium proavitum TaxID=1408281 RepID=A0A0G3WI96_9BACT|nr:homoserine O-acetyltransferase [Endomicrobium proavitum]AKL98406.1 Homoserine O-acetyltransferase [Endomicrobium proavitum]
MAKILTAQTQYFTFDKLVLESKQELKNVTVAYETYGNLNAAKTNAILIAHAFSGDAHAAGFHAGDDKPGWWDSMIGSAKAFDTDKYFVICSNVLGGCAGSTGPSSINPDTNKPYALDFPVITVADMVSAQKKLIDFLGIKKLLSVAGGSMGGMQVLQWAVAYPESLYSVIPIATTMKHSPQQIAFNEVARQSIMADVEWNKGDYYGAKHQPYRGLAVARMIGHITYMSDKSMEEKFSRNRKTASNSSGADFAADFEVEGYLQYRGDSFTKRFDANSYLYITKAMDLFDVSGYKHVAKNKDLKFLVISFASDWLYPSYQSENTVKQLKLKGYNTTYIEIKSTYGHDAFLLEVEGETKLIKHFLNKVSKEI